VVYPPVARTGGGESGGRRRGGLALTERRIYLAFLKYKRYTVIYLYIRRSFMEKTRLGNMKKFAGGGGAYF
jgi:hypothetical protein